MMNSRRSIRCLVAAAIACASCGGDEKGFSLGDTVSPKTPVSTTTQAASDTQPVPTDGGTTTATTVPPSDDAPATSTPPIDRSTELSVREIVEFLASDELEGRGNGTPGALAARQMLVEQLKRFAEPLAFGDGDKAYVQEFEGGANIVAVIPGGELRDEYVMIGGHYDHIGRDCDSPEDPTDTICNGAADNATGTAEVLALGRAIAATGTPRRSVILALWDREEDGLLGAAHYVQHPIVPLDRTKVYVNFDIQGTSLLPSLRNTTVLIGAETGGEPLLIAAQEAAKRSSLDVLLLSLLFGQGRSDHAVLVGAGVPSLFFTDANNGCYHRANDDLRNVDFPKLDRQIAAATDLTTSLIATDTPPVFNPQALPTTYDDAVSMLAVVRSAEVDLALLPPQAAAVVTTFTADLQTIVDAGDEAFDESSVTTLLGGSITLVDALRQVDCAAIRPE